MTCPESNNPINEWFGKGKQENELIVSIEFAELFWLNKTYQPYKKNIILNTELQNMLL